VARLKENLPLLAGAVRTRFDAQPPQAVFQEGDDRGDHGIRSAMELHDYLWLTLATRSPPDTS
jgi:hypothetical protein